MITDRVGRRTLAGRLVELASRIERPGLSIADVGTDHGLLPLFLLRRGLARRCIATDRLAKPLAQARRRQSDSGYGPDRLELRLGDGLSPLAVGEVECLVIAGIGDHSLARILDRGRDRLQRVRQLLLGPLGDGEAVRRWLAENGWELRSESLVEERGRLYPCLDARPGDGFAPYRSLGQPLDLATLIGPLLWDRSPQIARPRWEREREHLREVVRRAPQQGHPAQLRLERIERLLRAWRSTRMPPRLIAPTPDEEH